jgi:hypothetical protein
MKVAALSPNALTLPPAPSVGLRVVAGRQEVVRYPGLFFGDFRGRRRSLYTQLDGAVVLADECKCVIDWRNPRDGIGFAVKPVIDCPIDDHKAAALRNEQS